jgi:hypothetical protein
VRRNPVTESTQTFADSRFNFLIDILTFSLIAFALRTQVIYSQMKIASPFYFFNFAAHQTIRV